MDPSGNFVITWESLGQDGSSGGIYAQMYDNLGNPVGSEFQVNTYTTDSQYNPAVAMDSDGNFAIVWSGSLPDTAYSICAQMYDNLGGPVGSEFQVDTYLTGNKYYPDVAMNASGNFVITWSSLVWDGDAWGVAARIYDSLGKPVGVEFQVNDYITSSQYFSDVAMDPNGNFIITWTSDGQDGDGNGVYAKMYDSLGNTILPEFIVNSDITKGQSFPSIAMDSIGNFVITWNSWMSVNQADAVGIFMKSFYIIDQDGDGIPDRVDNCPNDFNTVQTDTDGDGIGDICDSFPYDSDNEKAQLEADLAQALADFAQCTVDLNLCESDLDQCLNPPEPPSITPEGKGKTCFDGIDNDGDGQTDCDDSDCASSNKCK